METTQINPQEKKLLEVLQQIKLEGEVQISLDSLLKASGISSYSTVSVVLRSQGFIENRSGISRISCLVWNRTEPPNIKMVRAIIAESKKRSSQHSKKYHEKKKGIILTNPTLKTDPIKPIIAKKEENNIEVLSLYDLHQKAVEEFERAKLKLSKIADLMKLYT